jgi:hypothetical protein
VSVSLEKCARAVGSTEPSNPPWDKLHPATRQTFTDIAEAVLTTAGVSYVK